MARHDSDGVISRKRRSQLAKLSKLKAGHWLRNDIDSAEMTELTEAEYNIVREAIIRIAERLIDQGSKKP